MNKIRLKILCSVKEDTLLYWIFPYYFRFNTGQDNRKLFFGHLYGKILREFKGKNKKEKLQIINKIVKETHYVHRAILKYNLKTIKNEWKLIGPQFISACQKTFDGCPFPQGEYKAVMTTWGRYPCLRKFKKFYFPAHTQMMLYVIIHELLHFAFFSYYNKYFKKQLNPTKVGILTEVLNVIIMNREPYRSWVKIPSQPYPAHKKAYSKLLPLYNQSSSMHEFIKRAIKVLKD